MARLAIRRVGYEGDHFKYESPDLADGLVIVEGTNGTGKTTLADLIYFALGGTVRKFAKKGDDQHKEIQGDENNWVHLQIEIDDKRYALTRRFDQAGDILVTDPEGTAAVLPVTRRSSDHAIFSDWILEKLGISVVTLFLGTYKGKLNFTDLMRLFYHDQDPDPSRVFKRADKDSFVTDSRDFRRAVFEILIGHASEAYYDALGRLKLAEHDYNEKSTALNVFKDVAHRALSHREHQNAHFLRESIQAKDEQQARLEATRRALRESAPDRATTAAELTRLRQSLSAVEMELGACNGEISATAGELVRLRTLETQLIEEAVRIQKIIVAHETLSLFSPDTCPCCLRKIDRPVGFCICKNPVDESQYQRFFYSPDEYLSILKSKQKNAETARAALAAADEELVELHSRKEELRSQAERLRQQMKKWAVTSSGYGTELEQIDDALVDVRVTLEALRGLLDLELERTRLEALAAKARAHVEELRNDAQMLELSAQKDRATQLAIFDKTYSMLMVETLKGVTTARLNADYEPVINEGEYREASAGVTRRLMYYLTLLKMSLADASLPFPRFLLIDTPDTAGIDPENLSRAIAKVADSVKDAQTQVLLTIGPDKYPPELKGQRVVELTEKKKLLQPKPAEAGDAAASQQHRT